MTDLLHTSQFQIYYLTAQWITVVALYTLLRPTTATTDPAAKRGGEPLSQLVTILSVCAALALCINHYPSALELAWTFSIYLEALALLPQLHMTYDQLCTEDEKLPSAAVLAFLALMGTYRSLYVANWVYRWHFEHFYDPIAFIAGVAEIGRASCRERV